MTTSNEYRLRQTPTGFLVYDADRGLIGQGSTADAALAALQGRLGQLDAEIQAAGLPPPARAAAAPAKDGEWRRFGFFALRAALVGAILLLVLPSPASLWRAFPPSDVVTRVLLDRLHQSAQAAEQAKPETVAAILADVRALAQASRPFMAELRAAWEGTPAATTR